MSGTVDALFHPVISVSDMAEAVRFYRDLLGMTVTFDDYHDPAAIQQLFGYSDPILHSVVVGCPDGSEIELVEFERPRGRFDLVREPADAGIMAVNLRVTDIDAIVERLRTGGYEPSSAIVPQDLPDGGLIRVIVCLAPDGVRILLVEVSLRRASLETPAAAAASPR